MTTSTGVVRHKMYAASGTFFIRALGDEDWVQLPHGPVEVSNSFQNVMRPTFTPGSFSVIQYTENATFDDKGELTKNLYMWKATFNTANLYDIRVKEYEFGHSDKNTNYRIRIELTAACNVPPAGQGLVTAAGVKRADVLDRAVETSESAASSVAIAEIANGWRSGNQEVKLTFTRTTQIKSGTKLWVWEGFMAFVCGAEWATQNRSSHDAAARKSLKEVVNAKVGNRYVEFEMREDDWILIKPKSSLPMPTSSLGQTEQRQEAQKGGRLSTMQATTIAGTSASRDSPAAENVMGLGSPNGKRKVVEEGEPSRLEKKLRMEERERLREEIARTEGECHAWQGECHAWQVAERHARDMGEKAAEKARELRLRIDALDM